MNKTKSMNEFGIINTNCWQENLTPPQVRTFVNTDEPKVMHIIPTGWIEPQTYAVVIEDGEMGYPDLIFLDANQIENKFNIKLN